MIEQATLAGKMCGKNIYVSGSAPSIRFKDPSNRDSCIQELIDFEGEDVFILPQDLTAICPISSLFQAHE